MSENREQPTSEKKIYRILLVDDDPDITLTYRTCLAKNGFEVDAFNDPAHALSNFRKGVYDLLLLDIKMPKMNGFELFEKIEKIDKDVKVCFITSFVSYYESLRGLLPTPKVNCFIKKPIETFNLVRLIKANLEIPS